ncbi:DUF3857 domain-containing protein [Flagellimonas olearia]|uniref:DUF3857 domain-containing protein n=1 Tax=Flagellimonas olearia TaxID=552546 RepID=A0A6I1E155_9FLAO|nr:DUF3857 domain-containing transglutaminase family protein [Allomuricauda olearia]KAB7529362.1 DUF3857 domain-containing protein [Allomuricauda olearia]
MRVLFQCLLILSVHFSFSQNYSYHTIPAELMENADAVARLDEIDIRIEAMDKMTYTEKKVVTVLNKSGDAFARTRAFYDKEKKIKKIEAVVYDASGNEIQRIKRRDFNDIAAVDGFSLYLDDRLLYYRYVPVQYPYTLEFSYEVETSDTGILPPWYFLSGYDISVEESRYAISYVSNGLKPIIEESNLVDITVEKDESQGKISYMAKNIPALTAESLSPSFTAICPKLSVRLPNFHYKGFDAKVDNWNDLGLWIQTELLSGRTTLEDATIQKVRGLVEGVDDDIEKAKIVYQYMQDNTRYISVQIGIGGFQPISAIEVDRVKYGDCKGLSNYTMALLKAVGVESYYTVVEAGGTKVDFKEDFADLSQGNHAIVAIPYQGEYYWIDCTSQVHPFGFIGDFTDDRKVLIVKPGGGEIVTTTSYVNEENLMRMNSTYTIQEDLSLEADVTIETMGVRYDNHFGLEGNKREDVMEYYKNFWGNINGLSITDFSFENNKDDVVFTEKVQLKAHDFVSKNGDDYLLTLNVLDNSSFIPPRYRNRKHSFVIQRGYLDEDEFTIQLPKNFAFTFLPEKYKEETKFGTYEVEVVKKSDTELLYKRKFLIKKGNYPKEEYNKYRSFRRTIAKMDNQKIVLKRQDL